MAFKGLLGLGGSQGLPLPLQMRPLGSSFSPPEPGKWLEEVVDMSPGH